MYFWHISLRFYSNFDQERSFDAEFDSASNEYPHYIFFMDPSILKTRNTWKMLWWHHHHIFHVFLVFGVEGSVKSVQCGTHWMQNHILHPLSSPDWNLSKNTRRYIKNTDRKSRFFLWQICQFNHYGWLILLEVYLFLNSNSQELIVGVFSYKAHFRPQISSNACSKVYINHDKASTFKEYCITKLNHWPM